MSETKPLFADDAMPEVTACAPAAAEAVLRKTVARVLMPNRSQLEFRASDLESVLSPGHRARLVWGYVERQELAGLYAGIKAVDGGVGRPAIAPEILYALWLYATLEGVGSARAIARLTEVHDAYRWICGGVQVNYHTLADFRSHQGEALDDLLTNNVTSLMAAGAVKFKGSAQDGMRVRASAGAASFRREETLKAYLEAVRQRVARLKAQVDDDPVGESARKQAAQQRAVAEREARIEAALARQPELAAIKKGQGKDPGEARCSTTDADATNMKMGDGGFRPAFNFQYVTDTESQVIIGVEVVTVGTDQGQLATMVEQVSERYGQVPENWLVDGGYPGHGQIDAVAEHTTVYAPVPKAKDPQVDIHQPKAKDSPAVAEWRQRMASDEAKRLYKDRASTAECVNALARNRGLNRLLVRGLKRVKAVALLFALAHNLMRTATLAPHLVGIGRGTSVVPQIAG
ncbi:IS1182 family transposase [Candidatus Accumulibacter sp. ACC007]|uniref:IS1182 family transposase n=1 Tax=Candidatus Accumulibacter sp. ACC007 TaxID=2823333 RepID=UPI0025C68204|nr:IS1182 family transposase [Candidatus Accumulibacter sp. ACC007]